jgi:hypothetical protein
MQGDDDGVVSAHPLIGQKLVEARLMPLAITERAEGIEKRRRPIEAGEAHLLLQLRGIAKGRLQRVGDSVDLAQRAAILERVVDCADLAEPRSEVILAEQSQVFGRACIACSNF